MAKENSMKKYTLGQYEKSMPNTLSWKEKLMYCKQFGFDYLEMSIDESDEKLSRLSYTKEERLALVQTMYQTDMRIGSICLSGHRKYPLGHPDPKQQEKALIIMEQAIQLAQDLGIPLIQLAGYDVYYEEGNEQTKTIFINNLKKAVQMASAKGIILGFETMETPFMDTVQKSMEYVNMVDNPYLGVYPDIGNLKNASLLYGVSVHDDLLYGKGHISAAHLKETIPNHYREIPFGSGHSEFEANITLLKELGVRKFVGEFWYVGNNDWKEVCKEAVVFLRKHLDHVFK